MKRYYILLILVILCITYFIFRSIQQADPVIKPNNSASAVESQTPASIVAPSMNERLKILLKSKDIPIAFYGIVIDDQGNSLSGAAVSWSVLKSGSHAPSFGLPTGAKGIVNTDASGKFSITESGFALSIDAINKTDYRESKRINRNFSFGDNSDPYQPDPSTPERFLMVKDDAETSVAINLPLNFKWDGTPNKFEIGSESFPETLILIATRDAQNPAKRGYNWKVVLKVENGQLISGKRGDAPLAPESGYVNEVILRQDAGPEWASSVDALLYIKTNSNRFSESKIYIDSDINADGIISGELNVRWNLTGGRAFR